MKRARLILACLLALLAIGAALLGSRALILYGARSVLDRWSEAGFPGDAPRGGGPYADFHWPPHVTWRDLKWGDDGPLRLSCSRLEIAIAPLDLIRGRVSLRRVDIRDLHVSSSKPVSPWTDLVLASLTDSSGPTSTKPARDAVLFNIAPVSFDSSAMRLARLAGWAWAPSAASWSFVANVSGGGSRTMILRGNGSGAAGAGDVTLDAGLGRGSALHLSGRRPIGGVWSWQLSGRDDGALASSIIAQRLSHALPIHGSIDFNFSHLPPAPIEGDVQLQDIRIAPQGAGDREGWTVDGQVCLSGGRVDLQACYLTSPEARVRIDAEIPLDAGDSVAPGRCTVDGSWSGSVFRFDGTIHRARNSLVLHAPCIERGGLRTGIADFRLIGIEAEAGAPPVRSRVAGVVRLGSGSVEVEGGAGPASEPLILRGKGIPVDAIEPWLPFRAPGDWTGQIDADAALRLAPGGWRWIGTASLSRGRVRGFPLLDQIAALRSEKGGGAILFDRISTAWSYAPGRFFADSLLIRSRTMTVQGAIFYASPDSLLALLRILPGEEDAVSSLLRLFGGASAALDLGIAGSAQSPRVEVLDRTSKARWRDQIESVRRAIGGS